VSVCAPSPKPERAANFRPAPTSGGHARWGGARPPTRRSRRARALSSARRARAARARCRGARAGVSPALPPRAGERSRPSAARRRQAAGCARPPPLESLSVGGSRAGSSSSDASSSQQGGPPASTRSAAMKSVAPAHRGDALAQQGARPRSLAGRPAGASAGARALLGHRLRLAQSRGEAERAPAVHDRDRRGRDPLHPREVASRERAAADHDARLARLGHRAAREHRPPDRPDRSRWHPRGRIPPGAAVLAWLRLLGRADRARLGEWPHRTRVGGADGPSRLRALRRPRGRRGRRGHGRDGPPGARGAARSRSGGRCWAGPSTCSSSAIPSRSPARR
jgi:hypothetical protein